MFTGAMEVGGIERSLIGLLDGINYEKYEVDLFLYAHRGALYNQINKNVNILPEVKELSYLRESFISKIKHGCYYSAYRRIIDALRSIRGNYVHDKSWFNIMNKFTPNLNKNYDLAISFFLPFDVIKEKVSAKVKIGWIHTDYKAVNEDRDVLKKQYDSLDFIAAVSEACKESFIEILPELKNKVIVVENILSKEQLYKAADLDLCEVNHIFAHNVINILSIGRFCEAKNFDNIPEICKRLIDKGLKIKWYIIGFGSDEKLIRERIKQFKMEKHVIILGKKDNPYPYIKACDIYIQPSRYEGKCVAVREAQILGKPVIITKYATSSSQLKDGYDGIIVPMDNEGCANGIYDVITDKNLLTTIMKNCTENDYTNKQEICKLYNIINSNR